MITKVWVHCSEFCSIINKKKQVMPIGLIMRSNGDYAI